MDKIKIMVCTHKQDYVYSNDEYIPIHAGKAISKIDLGIVGDNTGDNISERNPYFCELTVQYWGWKNLDCEYIGLCHYRRYFDIKIDRYNIDNIMLNYDVILPNIQYTTQTIASKLIKFTCLEDFYILCHIIKNKKPEYLQTTIDYLYNTNKDIAFNMLICRKNIYDEFMKWQFDILFECEKYIKISPYTRGKRVFGYFAEVLLPIYFLHHKFKIKHMPLASMLENKNADHFFHKIGILNRYRNKLRFLLNKYPNYKPISEIPTINAVKAGLENDNIKI